jgi:hypothetical protein
MDTIYTDIKLRESLHSLYVAQFKAIKRYPEGFDKNDATRMLTGLMGARPWSWRVIGITEEALNIFAEHDYKRPAGLIQRGHRFDRSSTAQALFFDLAKPMPLEDFFSFFLERDETVLMSKGENRHRPGGKFPPFIKIPRRSGLFRSGSLVGWLHRKEEIAFLRELHARRSS